MQNPLPPAGDSSPLAIYGDRQSVKKIFYQFTIATLLSLIAAIFIVLTHNDTLIAVIIAISLLPVLGIIVLIRQEKFEWAAMLLALLLITLLTVVATLGLGIHNISNLGFPVILIISSLVIHRNKMIILTSFTVGCMAWLVFGELSGIYTPTVLVKSVTGDFFSASVAIVITAFMVRRITETMFQGNRQIQKELRERQQAEAKLEQDIALRMQAEEEIRRLNAELEQRVMDRTAELASANRELESLSYTIGHDLRSPTRAIVGYSSMLMNGVENRLNKDEYEQLRFVNQEALRMGRMVDEFLTFLRLGRAPLRHLHVQMTALAKSVVAELQTDLKTAEVDFSVLPMPDCMGDESHLHDVYYRLISNAIKFSRPRHPARIEIGAIESEGETCYFVRDNGIGFDMKYADKLFGVFERLHNDREFEGIGIGLATVQRIIHRHGGRIWAEAEANKGATFYFTLG